MKELCLAMLIVLIASSSAFSTTMSSRKYKCAVCGNESSYRVITSTNAFGPSDLDLRPPEMQRSTMPLWVQECRNCGYVASEISDSCDVSPDFLKSEEYLTCEGRNFESDLAARFYKVHMIEMKRENIVGGFYAVLHASWSCDDVNDTENAKICREKAASLASEILAVKSMDDSERASLTLMRADILRRAGHFREVISEYSAMKFKDDGRNNPDVMNAIVKFQVERARANDTKCYTVEDAVKE